ncbi:MAG: 5'-deoxynucleotidase [Clostridiaceae bacterium]|nr:5'-deoxynucleotidase [Clostridiaceae bacterium]
MTTAFFAMMHRLKYIQRWGLMRNTETENVQEHSHEVAIIAHALAILRKNKFSEGRICPDPDYVATLALYHDAAEIMTGDMPSPIKYHNDPMRETYKAIEEEASKNLLRMLPEELQPLYEKYLIPADDEITLEALKLIKAADRFSACIKCLDEFKVGNKEFVSAYEDIKQRLMSLDLPEVRWFADHALQAYSASLDELSAF